MPTASINHEMIERCYEFSYEIIHGNNQYNRIPATINTRIERTFVGKLAEYSFLRYLNSLGIDYPKGSMFEINEGVENVDNYDFLTNEDNTVDVKAASKPFHRRIMVPLDQFENLPKDYYVGVKLNSRIDEQNGSSIVVESITETNIYGFCTYQDLLGQNDRDFGEGTCKHYLLNNLKIKPQKGLSHKLITKIYYM